MPDHSMALGLDPGDLRQRIDFLLGRARWHGERVAPLERACAATLTRDAAILALIVGETEQGRALLEAAGDVFVGLGLLSGLLLQRLGGATRLAVAGGENRLVARFVAAAKPDREVGLRDDFEPVAPFEREARKAPRQVLDLYQALRVRPAGDGLSWQAADLARQRLLRANGQLPVGLAGLPLDTFLPLLDRMAGGEPARSDRDTLMAAAIRHGEWIRAARADGHRWRRAERPAVIADLDIVALGVAGLLAGREPTEIVMQLAERPAEEGGLPFRLARDLADETPEPQPLFR